MTEAADGPDPGPKTIHVYPADGIEKANNAPTGSTVLLHGGTYPEPLIPINSNIIFQAAPGEVPVIDGKGIGKSGIVLFQLSDITLDGLKIQNWNNLGNAQGCKRFKLKNCRLTNGHTSGFWANTSEDCEITGNTIDHCGNGIGDDGLSFAFCSGLLVENNNVSHSAHIGIQLLNCNHCIVRNNLSHNNGSSGISGKRGLTDSLFENNFVSHSAFSNESSEQRRDAGIQIVGSRNRIRLNRVQHCGGGIILSLDADASIMSNDNVIELNTLFDIEEAGLDFNGYPDKGGISTRMTRNRISKNIMWGAKGVDLRLQFRGTPEFWGNIFNDNVAGIVQVLDGSPPPHEAIDPRLDPTTLRSSAFPDRGWQG